MIYLHATYNTDNKKSRADANKPQKEGEKRFVTAPNWKCKEHPAELR